MSLSKTSTKEGKENQDKLCFQPSQIFNIAFSLVPLSIHGSRRAGNKSRALKDRASFYVKRNQQITMESLERFGRKTF